jgi:glycosyltransferase involved in cell wall biosynthesis
MKEKLRVLSVGEFTQLATGFAIYHKELLNRLHASGKYHIAELAIFGEERDPRAVGIPWTWYGNMPGRTTDPKEYHSNQIYGFGLWRFNHVLADYRPHVVIDFRDPWMTSFIPESPFRPQFKFGLMPTYDSHPSDVDWLPAYIDADALFTYSTWAIDKIDKQCGGQEKMLGSAPPAYDKKYYKPVLNKEQHRAKFGLMPNINLALFISRNQMRKLFPDLFASFRVLLNKYKDEGKLDLYKRTYLYCHTSFPDVGWKLDQLLMEYGIAGKVLFSYICQRCHTFFPSFFQGARTVCKHCHTANAVMPNTQTFVPSEILAEVYNLADVYVQTAICEGAGMSQAEAAACGVPVMAVDYSAMESNVRELKGTPIEVQRMFFESDTHAYRAYFSCEDLAQKLYKFFSLPPAVRAKKGFDAHKACKQNFDYDKSAKQWEKFFDTVDPLEMEEKWKLPPRIHQPQMNLMERHSTSAFLDWAIVNTLGDPSKLNSLYYLRLLTDLNQNLRQHGRGGIFHSEMSIPGQMQAVTPYSREECLKELAHLCEYRNQWEKVRVGIDPYPITDCVKYARNRK